MLTHLDWRPDRKKLRRFGWYATLVFGCAGGWGLVGGGWGALDLGGAAASALGAAFVGLACVCGVLAIAHPPWLRPLFVGLTLLGLPVGWLVLNVALAVVYYGLMTPVALVFWALRRDPLARKLDRSASSYWVDRPPSDDPEDAGSHLRQF